PCVPLTPSIWRPSLRHAGVSKVSSCSPPTNVSGTPRARCDAAGVSFVPTSSTKFALVRSAVVPALQGVKAVGGRCRDVAGADGTGRKGHTRGREGPERVRARRDAGGPHEAEGPGNQGRRRARRKRHHAE